MENPRVRLGELLVRAGLITGRQLEEALVEQRRVGKRLGSLLVETGLVSETQVTQILSQQLSVPWVSLHHIDFSRELLDLVPVDAVERFCLVPIYVRRVRGLGDALYVAMDDPTNTQALAEVSERSGLHVRAMIAPPSDIRAAIHAYYGIGEPPPAPASVERRPVEEAQAAVNAGGASRAETAPKAPRVVEARAPAHETAQAESTQKVSASVKNGTSEDLRSIAPAKRAAAPREGVTVAVQVESRALPAAVGAAAPAPVAAVGAANDVPASVRATAQQQGAERLRRAMGDGARGDAGKQAGRRMVALTLLDGTTIRLPAKGKGEAAADEGAPTESNLTAREMVSALRAAAHGVDATEVLGDDVRWERLFAALLSVLLKKHLISDWEFVEELTKG